MFCPPIFNLFYKSLSSLLNIPRGVDKDCGAVIHSYGYIVAVAFPNLRQLCIR